MGLGSDKKNMRVSKRQKISDSVRHKCIRKGRPCLSCTGRRVGAQIREQTQREVSRKKAVRDRQSRKKHK
jgi:hypothetical protein